MAQQKTRDKHDMAWRDWAERGAKWTVVISNKIQKV